MEALQKKVQAALNRADTGTALGLVREARLSPDLSSSDKTTLVLLEAQSLEDQEKAKDLLRGLLEKPDLSAHHRSQAHRVLGLRFYLEEQFSEALPHFAAARKDLDSGSKEAQEIAYFEGVCALEQENFARAKESFASALGPQDDLEIWARLGLAEIDLKQGKVRKALEKFQAIQLLEKASPYKAYVLTRQAECQRVLGQEKQALKILSRVRAKYPDSLAAFEAEKILFSTRNDVYPSGWGFQGIG